MFRGNRGAIFAIGLVLGVAITVLIVMVSTSNPFQNQPNYKECNDRNCDNYSNQESPIAFTDFLWNLTISTPKDTLAQWVMAFFALVATGASIWAVILLKRTLKATRDLNNLTSEAFLNEQRPWLKVTPNNNIEISRTDTDWFSYYGVTIENVGKSPAVNITFLTNTFFIDGLNNPNEEISIFREELLKKARGKRAINFGVMYPPDEPRIISTDNHIVFESIRDRMTGFVIYGVAYMQPGIEKVFLVMDGVFFVSPTSEPSMIGFDPKIVNVGEKISFNSSLTTIYKYLETHDRKIGT